MKMTLSFTIIAEMKMIPRENVYDREGQSAYPERIYITERDNQRTFYHIDSLRLCVIVCMANKKKYRRRKKTANKHCHS